MTTRPPRPKPAITLERRRVADLLADPRNARTHSERNLAEIAASLVKYGQQKNIVIFPDGQVIAGSGTLEAARQVGWEYLDVKVFAGTVDEARAYGLIDNRSAELAGWDPELLPEILRELPSELQEITGWTPEEITTLLGKPVDPITDPQLGDMEYRIIIECRDEAQQKDLLQRLEAEGLSCRAVMS